MRLELEAKPSERGGERGSSYVSWVPKKKMGYLFGGGFTAPSAMSSI